MATLQTTLPSVAFPWEIDTLTFKRYFTDSERALFTLIYGGQTIFEDEIMYFDIDGTFVLNHVGELLLDYDTHQAEVFKVITKDNSFEGIYECQIIPNYSLTEPAAEVIDRSYLTLLTGAKHSAPDGVEVISLYTSSGESVVTIEYTYLTADGECARETEQRAISAPSGRVSSFAIDFSTLSIPDGATLVGVALRVGPRHQAYIINPQLRHSLRFLNSFGQEDVIYFTELEIDAKSERSLAVFDGVVRAHRVTPNTTIKGTTLPLMESELVWAEEAANALYLRNSEGRPVAVTDSELRYTTSPQDLPQLVLTWKEAHPYHQFGRDVHTFDTTFDTTYL